MQCYGVFFLFLMVESVKVSSWSSIKHDTKSKASSKLYSTSGTSLSLILWGTLGSSRSWLNAMQTSRVQHINSQHWYVYPFHMGDGHCSSMQCQDALRMISFSCCPFPVDPNAPFQCLSSLSSRTILSNTNANHKYQMAKKKTKTNI